MLHRQPMCQTEPTNSVPINLGSLLPLWLKSKIYKLWKRRQTKDVKKKKSFKVVWFFFFWKRDKWHWYSMEKYVDFFQLAILNQLFQCLEVDRWHWYAKIYLWSNFNKWIEMELYQAQHRLVFPHHLSSGASTEAFDVSNVYSMHLTLLNLV